MIELIAYVFIIVGAIGVLSLYSITKFIYALLLVTAVSLLVRVLSIHR